jgi:hypothetical protein
VLPLEKWSGSTIGTVPQAAVASRLSGEKAETYRDRSPSSG